jgi:hypothetical protein
MLTDKLKALEATKAKLAELQESVAAELNKELAALPARYGFDNVPAFVKAVQDASRGKAPRSAGKATAKAAPASGGKRRKRAVITQETRSKVKSMVEAGKTGGEIAKAVGISLPSVQNIKKALGLVKERK